MSQEQYDLVIIGGGPAGYVGAIRAGQLGLKVACIERDALGGTCLNWGCIPTKALLGAAEFYQRLQKQAASMGILADNIRHDWSAVIGRSRKIPGNLSRGIAGLFKKNKVTHLIGHGRIAAPGKVQVLDASGQVTAILACRNILIATGAGPRPLPGADFDGNAIISSKEAMNLEKQPQSLLIIGGGAIGVEFAYFYHAFGTKVTLVEVMDRILPIEDRESSAAVEKSFRRIGIDVRTGTKVLSLSKTEGGVEVTLAPAGDESKAEKLVAEKALVAIGVRSRYDNLLVPGLELGLEKERIKAPPPTYQTSIPGIYAVGDVVGPPWLAHVASEEAVVCVEQIAGHKPHPIDYESIPGCTYCQPQVASVGLTEETCKARNIEYKVGKFPFSALGKAQATGHTEGFVKIIAGAKHGEILGVHMVGDGVTDLIAEAVLARRLEATAEELIQTIHAHPTLTEAVHEAALATQGRTIHF